MGRQSDRGQPTFIDSHVLCHLSSISYCVLLFFKYWLDSSRIKWEDMTRLWRLQIPFKNDSCFVYPSTNRTLLQQGCTGHLGSKPLDTHVYPNVNTSSHFPRLFHFLFLYLPCWILRWVTAVLSLPDSRSRFPVSHYQFWQHPIFLCGFQNYMYFIWIFFLW